MATIRVGVGGWVFAPWRGSFYPAGLPQARELEYASRKLTSIEINGTFYGTQKPASFRRWHAETPLGFVFSLKGPRYATHRRELGDAASSIERFFGSGVLELREKLGPVLWQFPATTRFDAKQFAAFLALLPDEIGGMRIRHTIEMAHESFVTPQVIELAREHSVALALVDSEKHPAFFDLTGDFVYARLKRSSASEPAGYPPPELDLWAERFRLWAAGSEPKAPRLHPKSLPQRPRDCFVYIISGAKERAPAAAQALLQRLQGPAQTG
jgi:uncharacterized protein YecE (DUF72 family)